MNELQIIDMENKDLTTWNFAKIKRELESALEIYKSSVYTDEKSAKEDKAKLGKAKKLLEDRRKEFKEKCLEPYAAIEPQIKELVDMIEEQKQQIDEVVKDYTELQKREKESEIRAYYDKKSKGLGKYANALYGRILDPKWLNKTATKAKYQEEMLVAINKSESDIKEIQAIRSPFADVLMEVYAATLSLDEVKSKHEELMQAMSRAGLDQAKQVLVQEIKEEKKPVVVDEANGITVRFLTNKSKLDQVLDFAKAIGAHHHAYKCDEEGNKQCAVALQLQLVGNP